MDAVKTAVIRAQPEVMIEQLTSHQNLTGESMSAATLNHRIQKVPICWQVAGVRRYLRQSIAF